MVTSPSHMRKGAFENCDAQTMSSLAMLLTLFFVSCRHAADPEVNIIAYDSWDSNSIAVNITPIKKKCLEMVGIIDEIEEVELKARSPNASYKQVQPMTASKFINRTFGKWILYILCPRLGAE